MGVALVNTLRQDLSSILNGNVTLYPTGSIIASKVKSFRLDSIYYGCKLYTATPLTSLTTACELSATGYDETGAVVNEATFSYTPNSILQAKMDKKEFGAAFDRVSRVDISVVNSALTPLIAVLNIDNVEVCLYP